MGGAVAGEVASAITAKTVDEYLLARLFRPGLNGLRPGLTLPDDLTGALELANERVYQQATSQPKERGMGTTGTLALMRGSHLYVAHVGDSRAYLVTAAGLLFQVTEDHSLVASLLAVGELTPEEAAVHPQRNLLYRCLGDDATVIVDTYKRRILPGDRLLLCSDGLTAHLSDADITAEMSQDNDPATIADRLVETANTRGGTDNVSVVVLIAEEPV
jgi:protein phosphatase